MGRKKNKIETEAFTVSTTPQVVQYLDALVASGLYGKTTAEAAERLVTQRIEQLIKEGALKRLQG